MKKLRTTNSERRELIKFLKRQGAENDVNIWPDVAERLGSSRRTQVAVNISRINRCTKKHEVVAVPGKVLSAGEMDHPITIAAFAFSQRAEEKIVAAKGKCVSYQALAKKYPKGSNIRIIR